MRIKRQILLIVVFGVITACGGGEQRSDVGSRRSEVGTKSIYSEEYCQAEKAVKRLEIEVLKQYYGKIELTRWLKEQKVKD